MLRRIAISLTTAVLLALPATAGAHTLTARGADLTAAFAYTGSGIDVHDGTLTIINGETTAYRGQVSYRANGVTCGTACAPLSLTGAPALEISTIEPFSVPSVLLNLYTGGAHCCSVVEIFGATGNDTAYHEEATHDFGDPGYRLLAGANANHVFATADDRFAYRFTDFAGSGLPEQVLQFTGTRFRDVTDQYERLIVSDASRWLTAYHKMARDHYSDSVGVIAAWAADEARLHRFPAALAYLRGQARAGHLTSTDGGKTGNRFIAALQAFLHQTGYLG